jgi:hypothetical protein
MAFAGYLLLGFIFAIILRIAYGSINLPYAWARWALLIALWPIFAVFFIGDDIRRQVR